MPIKVIQWDLDAWEDYLYWQSQDKKNLNANCNNKLDTPW